jgi:hypothetical protein
LEKEIIDMKIGYDTGIDRNGHESILECGANLLFRLKSVSRIINANTFSNENVATWGMTWVAPAFRTGKNVGTESFALAA